MKVKVLEKIPENIVAKEEIACFEQFIRLSKSIQKSSASEASESVYVRKRDITDLGLVYRE